METVQTGDLVVKWVLQLKEVIALCGLLWLIWFVFAKHIPFILMRDQNRADKEADRAAAANQKDAERREKDTERTAAAHARDQERWAAAIDKITAVLERLDSGMHNMVAKMEEIARQPRGRS